MKRLAHLAIGAMTLLMAWGMSPLSQSLAQQKTLKEQLVGTWSVVSAVDVKPDGTKSDQWGTSPKSTMMYTPNGRYVFAIMRSDIPKITAKSRAEIGADEATKIARGIIVYFGTYSVNESDKTVTYKIEGSSYPNMIGVDQKRIITSISADELKYTNAASAEGAKVEGIWRRVN